MFEKVIIVLMLFCAVVYFGYLIFSKKKGCNCGSENGCMSKLKK